MLSRLTLNATRRSSRYSTTNHLVAKAVMSTNTTTTTITMKPWKQSKVETNGDYRGESWLEGHIGGPLYEHQKSLPRLPVPDVADTMKRFLPTALPLAKTPQEAKALQDAVAKFPSQAATLQERLLQRREEFNDSSWLQLWWNQLGYLQVRDSIVINVSYFFQFKDDPTTHDPIQRAASAITALCEYRAQICSGSMPAEAIGRKDKQKVLCSTAFKYMFHSCRIPKLVQDSVQLYDPSKYHHAIVIRKGQYYAMDVCDPVTNQPYNIETLEQGLKQIQQMADTNNSTQLKLGYMTGINRDNAANMRQSLLQQGGAEMEAALDVLQSGAFCICLDDTAPVSRRECAETLLHGGAGDEDAASGTLKPQGYNRWFDKSVQIVVSENGKCGFTGEHSMMDGMPLVGLANHITNTTYKDCSTKKKDNPSGNPNVRPIFSDALLQKLNTNQTQELVQKAKSEFDTLVLNNSLHVQSFQAYGSDFIKKAGFSPDAFVQMAIQLATYRLWSEQAGTYEATQVRPFLHGRTETTRSVSTESAAFCQRFGLRPKLDDHDAAARTEKLALLKAAVDAHVKYIGTAAQAQGVDRHFFGLAMLVQDGEQAPDLMSDPVFQRAKRWRVSTSHLTHPKFDGWGFGQVYPDGVGIAYSIHPRHCMFNIAALKEHGWTDKLSELLEESLLEMRTLVEIEQASSTSQKSKL